MRVADWLVVTSLEFTVKAEECPGHGVITLAIQHDEMFVHLCCYPFCHVACEPNASYMYLTACVQMLQALCTPIVLSFKHWLTLV